jgi:hypothetical protein
MVGVLATIVYRILLSVRFVGSLLSNTLFRAISTDLPDIARNTANIAIIQVYPSPVFISSKRSSSSAFINKQSDTSCVVLGQYFFTNVQNASYRQMDIVYFIMVVANSKVYTMLATTHTFHFLFFSLCQTPYN